MAVEKTDLHLTNHLTEPLRIPAPYEHCLILTNKKLRDYHYFPIRSPGIPDRGPGMESHWIWATDSSGSLALGINQPAELFDLISRPKCEHYVSLLKHRIRGQ